MQSNIIRTNQIDFVGDAEAVLHTLRVSSGALCLDDSPLDTGGTTPAEITLTDGHILVGQTTGKAGDKALSNEASIDHDGALTLANSAVIGKVLTGLSAGSSYSAPAATDTILQAMNKITYNCSNDAIVAKVLTGLSAGSNTPILATDTILAALANLQAQITDLA